MKSGDIFTLDETAIEEVADFSKVSIRKIETKIKVNDVFSVAKNSNCNGPIVYASRWVDGKPSRGRPRQFPRATVIRLLGEAAVEAVEQAQTAEEQRRNQEEEKRALEERAAELLSCFDEATLKAAEESW